MTVTLARRAPRARAISTADPLQSCVPATRSQPIMDAPTPPGAEPAHAPPAPAPVRASRAGMLAMVALTSAANVVNYASSFAFSRVLEPVGFGELTSLLALSVVLTVPLGAAQTVVAERIAVAHAGGEMERVRYLIRLALGHVCAIAAFVGVIYVACIPLLVDVLDLQAPGPAIALAPLIVLTFINPVVMGVLQGMERFAVFGVVIFATAASRLLFGVPWALSGGGAGGAIAGQALGLLAVSLLAGWRYRALLLKRGTGAATRGLRRRLDVTALSASGAFIGFALLSNLDLVLARVFLASREAGIYAAVATIAKIIIFLPSAVAVVMVPRAARAVAESRSSQRVLVLSAAVVAGAVVVAAIPGLVAPQLLVGVMFGSSYEGAVDGVLPALVSGGALAMLSLVCSYSVAIRDRRWMVLLIGGVMLQVGAIATFHGSAVEVAWAQAAVALAVLLGNEALFHSLVPLWRRRS